MSIFTVVGHALDPKRDFETDAPRPLLFAKRAVEYLFRIVGFFILLCLVVGLSLAHCSESLWLALFPLLLGASFIFYIVITTIGIPIFYLIGEIKTVWRRRVAGYTTILLLFCLTFYGLLEAPVFEVLETYVSRYFPEAYQCKTSVITLGN